MNILLGIAFIVGASLLGWGCYFTGVRDAKNGHWDESREARILVEWAADVKGKPHYVAWGTSRLTWKLPVTEEDLDKIAAIIVDTDSKGAQIGITNVGVRGWVELGKRREK